MTSLSLADLSKLLSPHLPLGKTRLDTLCLVVLGMISARTVNLTLIATEWPGRAKVASTYRRLQRFFQKVLLPKDWAAGVVIALIGKPPSWHLCLDRTNWKLGKTDINILVLAVVTARYRVPLMWTVLDHAGNSNTAQRIALMKRYLKQFDVSCIRMLLADREFIGQEWLVFLADAKVPFAIRLKEDQIVRTQDGRLLALKWLLRRGRGVRGFTATLPARDGHRDLDLHFGVRRIKGGQELLIVASATKASGAHILRKYKKRWSIECLFADCKTRGLNLEDTHLRCPDRLHLLFGLLAVSVALINRAAAQLLGLKHPARKKHGHYAKSWFRTGFDVFRKALACGNLALMIPTKIPKLRLLRSGVV